MSRPSRVLDVSTVVQQISDAVEHQVGRVLIEGEISNFTQARSGHCYFVLKDDSAQISCVMWSGVRRFVGFAPEDGMLVRVEADASVYAPRGQVQLVVRTMEAAGDGALRKAFEAMKRRLDDEGLFDPSRKRPLPSFPKRIGIVTSGAGAALHDIVSTLERRFPCVGVTLCSTRVQGDGAADEIAGAIRRLNRSSQPIDLLIVGRGGGSIEDLWAFNEEVVARAIFASSIPVISAVGHETDESISDLVADRRAATPTMAAEIAVPDRRDLRERLRGHLEALRAGVAGRLQRHRERITLLARSVEQRHPRARLETHWQRIDQLDGALARSISDRIERATIRLEHLNTRLQLLDPDRPLDRGFARVMREDRIVQRAADLQTGESVTLQFADDSRGARIEEPSGPLSGAEK